MSRQVCLVLEKLGRIDRGLGENKNTEGAQAEDVHLYRKPAERQKGLWTDPGHSE